MTDAPANVWQAGDARPPGALSFRTTHIALIIYCETRAKIWYLQQHVVGLVIRKREEVCDGSVVRDLVEPLVLLTLHIQVTPCLKPQLIPVFTSLVIQVFHSLSLQSTARIGAVT